MALLGKEKFSPDRMETLRKYLETYHERGEPLEFEILLDGSKAVQRTSDPKLFDLYEALVTADTRSVEVVFYRGKSNHNDRRIFIFGETPSGTGELSGLDMKSEIKKQVEAARTAWEQQQLKAENQTLKQQVGELEETIEELEEELEGFKSKQSPLNGILGEVGSTVMESFIRKNPQLLNGLPLNGLGALPGAKQEATEEREVQFKAKQEESTSSPKRSEEEQHALLFMQQMKEVFSKEEFDRILKLLEAFANDKAKIDTMLSLL